MAKNGWVKFASAQRRKGKTFQEASVLWKAKKATPKAAPKSRAKAKPKAAPNKSTGPFKTPSKSQLKALGLKAPKGPGFTTRKFKNPLTGAPMATITRINLPGESKKWKKATKHKLPALSMGNLASANYGHEKYITESEKGRTPGPVIPNKPLPSLPIPAQAAPAPIAQPTGISSVPMNGDDYLNQRNLAWAKNNDALELEKKITRVQDQAALLLNRAANTNDPDRRAELIAKANRTMEWANGLIKLQKAAINTT